MDVTDTDKQTILLHKIINCYCNRFYSTGPRSRVPSSIRVILASTRPWPQILDLGGSDLHLQRLALFTLVLITTVLSFIVQTPGDGFPLILG